MSQEGKFWNAVKQQAKGTNQNPVQVGQIVSVVPLSIDFQGIVISAINGDCIYINNLVLDENINLDTETMDEEQNINPALWKGDNVPTSTVAISGTQKQFTNDFYNWVKQFHNRFILHPNDFVAVQKLGNNTYLVLEKVQKIEQ